MKATNKQEFFELLEAELHRIGIEDTKDIFADFEEHFTDGAMQGIPDDVTAERLGDIKEIARSYLNLESSRINSIMARDVERRKVSLTKPGRGVPADLSLIGSGSAQDIANSDNIREYTPQHFSSEIYPQSPSSSAPVNGTSIYGNGAAGMGTSMGAGTSANGTAPVGAAAAAGAAGAAANKTVADAFSDAGRAALDAAKLTGQVVADAFKQRGAEVKDAVTNAGKTAADAMRAAGQSAADVVRGATKSRKKNKAAYGAPRPSDTYREQMNTTNQSAAGRTAHIPPQHTKVKGSGGYKLIDSSTLTPNINAGKLIIAILLDCFLWIWLVPALIGSAFGIAFGGAAEAVVTAFRTLFGMEYQQYYFINRAFLAFGFFWLGIAALCVSVFLIKLIIRLVKFIINLHIRAIYDL